MVFRLMRQTKLFKSPNYLIFAGILVIMFGHISYALESSLYSDAIASVQKQIEAERQESTKIQTKITEERKSLRQSLKSIQRNIDSAKDELASLEDAIHKATSRIEKTQIKNEKSLRQFDRIWESLKFNVREFNDLYSLTLPEKNEIELLKDTMAKSNARGDKIIPLLQNLHDYYMKFFKKASSIVLFESSVYNESGEPVNAKILQLGLLGGIYWSSEEAGMIYLKLGDKHLQSAATGLSKKQRQLLRSSTNESSEITPVLLDLSQGWAIRKLGMHKNWKSFFASGGFVMYPLAAIAIIALLMIIERSIFYWLFSRSHSKLKKNIISVLINKSYGEAVKIIDTHKGPSKRFWSKCLELVQKKSARIDEAFQHVIISEIPNLERFLATLAVFAAICPLLGLLGTVSGMIKTFDVITVFGTGQHGMLSQGISEALVTTQVGLVLAIPILLAHAMLSRRSKLTIENLDQTAGVIVESIKNGPEK